MHTVMFALATASIVAFSFIIRGLFPKTSLAQRILGVMLFSIQPVIIGNVIDFNFDNGVMFFFVILLALLFYGYEKWMMIIGFLMVFTKESGVLLYGLTLVGYWIFFLRRNHTFLPDALRSGIRRSWLLLPLFLYLFHMGVQKHIGNPLLHENIAPDTIVHAMLSLDLLHERFLTFLTEIFLFQFTWFQTGVTVCALLVWLWRRDSTRSYAGKRFCYFLLIIFLYVTGIHTFTRYVPYNNIRYMMPLFPLGILLFIESTLLLGRGKFFSTALLAIAIALNALALFRSVDPVSRALLGTFKFGSHSIYALGSFDGCCLFGRDQLVYNLEYRKIFSLQDLALQKIAPSRETVIALPPNADWSHRDALDPVTFRRTWSPEGLMPTYVSIDDVLKMAPLPVEFYSIDFPNLPTDAARSSVEEKYDRAFLETIVDGGYSIGLTKYVLKP